MKEEHREMELYRETFSEVHAPDALKGKVKDMANNKKALWTAALKKCAAVAALAAIVFTSSNVVTYAATGETWVKMVTVNINGKKLQAQMIINEDTAADYHMHVEEKRDEKSKEHILTIEEEPQEEK